MKTRIGYLMVILFYSVALCAQKDKDDAKEVQAEKVEVIGMVMDMNGLPLKGVKVFVDSIKTKAKTNKKGIYKIKIKPDTKLLTVYSEDLGILNMEYTGQKKVSFLYKQDSKPVNEEELADMGFKLYSRPQADTSWYADFATVLDILDKRFYFAKVTNGKVKIGKGTNQFSGDSDPLLLVDNQRMPINALSTIATSDVQLIRVIHDGSEAAQYGSLQAANGVILITMKK